MADSGPQKAEFFSQHTGRKTPHETNFSLPNLRPLGALQTKVVRNLG